MAPVWVSVSGSLEYPAVYHRTTTFQRKLTAAVRRRPRLALFAQLVLGLGASLALLLVLESLAEEVVEGETHRFDEAVLLWIDATLPGWLELPMRTVTTLGYYWFVGLVLAVSCYLFYRRRMPVSAALLVVSAAGSMVITTALKALYQRTRPEVFETNYVASFYSFPSGHATVAVGFYGVLTLLVAYRLTGTLRWLAVAAGAALILSIGFSRLYLGVHYPSDILAGYLAAGFWAAAGGSALYTLHHLKRSGRYLES
jgi:undecaprenyl-diphosphatase